jgi:serine/threonine-protein kinase
MSGAQEKSSRVARYRLLRELGHRSQRTWAAVRCDGSNALVVINRWSRDARHESERVSAEAMTTLLRDARCLARNWHPNIARVRDVVVSGDTLYVATEMLDGVTLEDLLVLARQRAAKSSGAPLSHAVLARIFLDVLSGLHALHSLRDGIRTPLDAYHGELCPANVVIGRDGITRVIDPFRPRPVTIGAQSEAVRYAPPETLAGEAKQDARVDVYAAGVMLWETLMDRRLYDDADPARVAQRQREEDVPHPETPLGDVAMKAIAFDPLLRWRSASEMAAAIRTSAETIAPGSSVAQIVLDLAGDRIRARRAELHPGGSGQRPAVQPPAPPPRKSGSLPRVSIATSNVVEEVIAAGSAQRREDSGSLMSFAKRPPILEGRFATGRDDGPTSETRSSSRGIADAAPTARQLDRPSQVPTPYAPPVRSKTAGPARIRKVVTLGPSPSEPDLETSYAPRPKEPGAADAPSTSTSTRTRTAGGTTPRITRRPVTTAPSLFDPPPRETPQDELPGPRQSIPHEQAAVLLEEARRLEAAAAADSIPWLDSKDLTEDESAPDVDALAIAREIPVSRQSLIPPTVHATVAPTPAETMPSAPEPAPPLEPPAPPPPPPSLSSIDILTSTLAEPPPPRPRAESIADVGRPPSVRPPAPVDVAPPPQRSVAEPRGHSLPLIAGIAVLAIAVLLAGAAILSRRSADPTQIAPAPPTDSVVAPPGTIVVPPPVVEPLPAPGAEPTTEPAMASD